ncbi:hypothetical protein [Streptomyces sp. NPDC058045]|uniref:hypothetical protein n=1 Tax=Streptomyces sp. NPDC058045 TaxID=3346311 RepID=UPI0036E5549A
MNDSTAGPADGALDDARPPAADPAPAPGERPWAEGGTEAGVSALDPAPPAPLGVARADTGQPEVDAVLRRLADVDHLATEGHLEVYEEVHQGLRSALTGLDTRPGPPPPR